jgi:hypothetical protein
MLKGMKTTTCTRLAFAGLLALAAGALGCFDDVPTPKKAESQPAPAKNEPPAKQVEVGKNVFLEVQGSRRRVVVNAYVCLRECDHLEQLLCRKMTKEHEAILAADMDARKIHAALLLAGAEPGSPVQYQPYRPARGTRIKVLLRYQDGGKTVTVPAQKWMRNIKTNKDLEYDWVFAGSHLTPHPEPGQPPIYEANSGDVICVANFDVAMLDLPVKLPNDNDELQYGTRTARIPALGTAVQVLLEPMPEPKKKQ